MSAGILQVGAESVPRGTVTIQGQGCLSVSVRTYCRRRSQCAWKDSKLAQQRSPTSLSPATLEDRCMSLGNQAGRWLSKEGKQGTRQFFGGLF
jgi:hypothetical protein